MVPSSSSQPIEIRVGSLFVIVRGVVEATGGSEGRHMRTRGTTRPDIPPYTRTGQDGRFDVSTSHRHVKRAHTPTGPREP